MKKIITSALLIIGLSGAAFSSIPPAPNIGNLHAIPPAPNIGDLHAIPPAPNIGDLR